MSDREVCVFDLAEQAFAVDASAVREVVRVDAMKRVPRAHACIRGLFNLRGQIVPAIDLRRRLGLPARTGSQVLIVSELDGELVGFLVDSVRDVVTLAGESLEGVPSTVPEHVRKVVHGALPVEQGWLLCIDLALAAELEDPRRSEGSTDWSFAGDPLVTPLS
jgi:purine-binding chemotaxis protein CheW